MTCEAKLFAYMEEDVGYSSLYYLQRFVVWNDYQGMVEIAQNSAY